MNGRGYRRGEGSKNLEKLVSAVSVTGVFRTLLNIYDGAFSRSLFADV